MIERLLILACALALFALLAAWLRRRQLARAREAASKLSTSGPVEQLPTLIYFWSEHCGQCRSAQAPIIEGCIKTFGPSHLRVTRVDVIKEPEQAAAWGVKTVPTTYVLDQFGEVQYINNGVASGRVILEQLRSLANSGGGKIR